MGKRLKERTALGGRIARLREAYEWTTVNHKGQEVKHRGLKQSELAKLIQDRLGGNVHLTGSLISSWETGRRSIPIKYNSCLSDIFGVSEDYLTGNIEPETSDDELFERSEKLYEIKESELPDYNGEPLWIVFPDFSYTNQWALYNADNDMLVFKDRQICVKDIFGIKYYTKIPDYEDKSAKAKRALEYAQVIRQERVYVIMNSPDERIRARYGGWYINSSDKTCLVNPWNGLMLPYEGINVSYHAYSAGDPSRFVVDERLNKNLN